MEPVGKELRLTKVSRGWMVRQLHNDLSRRMLLRFLAPLACGVACCYPQSIGSLRRLTALTNEEWKAVQHGNVVAKVLETSHKRELAVAGVARIPVSRECFLQHFRDIEAFKKSPSVRQIGKFSTPIDPLDLTGLTLDSQDANALRECQVGSCRVKVPIGVIRRLANESEGTGQDYSTRATSVVREELSSYVEKYLSLGDTALIEYHDKARPVRLSEQFQSLLTSWTELNALCPEFCDLITRGPQQPLPYLEEFLYWSKESFGLRPVISVTHVSIYQLPDQTWIASKQIYASHYFDASLAVTLVADDPADLSGGSVYLAYLNRSRIDLLGGALAGLARGLVRGRLQEGMKNNLQQTVTKLEFSCRKIDGYSAR